MNGPWSKTEMKDIAANNQRHGDDTYANLQYAKVWGQLNKSDSGSEHSFFRFSE